MTLRDLIALHPVKFYPQTWYFDEPFMDCIASPIAYPTGFKPGLGELGLPRVASLAWLWCNDIDAISHPMWQHYIWCREVDRLGQRVYVGHNGHGLEIHRHLAITDRFVTALW